MSLERKKALVAELVQLLSDALEMAQRSHRDAIQGATHEQAKPENDKDTRGLEQSYLARGQSLRILEQEAQLASLKTLQLRPTREDAPVDLGSLVTLESEEKTQVCFVLPCGGGISLEKGAVQVVTPSAPLCQAILGKREGDEAVLTVAGKKREYVIESVE